MNDVCGHPTKGGEGPPCQNPATEGKSCWIPAHGGSAEDHGRPFPSPEKLNLQRQEDIAQTVEQGKSLSAASRMSGITPSTTIRWLQLGEEQDEGPYADFYERLTRALGHGQDTWESMLLAAAEDDPATIMAVLKTQFPDAWGDANRGEQSAGVTVQLGEAEEFEIDPETLEVMGQE